jgi:hypothetical protein
MLLIIREIFLFQFGSNSCMVYIAISKILHHAKKDLKEEIWCKRVLNSLTITWVVKNMLLYGEWKCVEKNRKPNWRKCVMLSSLTLLWACRYFAHNFKSFYVFSIHIFKNSLLSALCPSVRQSVYGLSACKSKFHCMGAFWVALGSSTYDVTEKSTFPD